MQSKREDTADEKTIQNTWKRVDAMKDSDIDFSDIPELGPDFFKNAILWRPREERNKREADPHIAMSFKQVMADVLKVKTPERRKKTKSKDRS